MPQNATRNRPDAKPRGFTNDGKVQSEIVNDSFGTVDPADSTGLDTNLDTDRKTGSNPGSNSGPETPRQK
jgi:hypothetical protein